jgi:uncharacterized protein (TIGR02147 family)
MPYDWLMLHEPLSYRDCLRAELNRRLQRNRAYSLRAFAQALRIEAGALSQYLSGKRIPSYKEAQKILNGLELAPNQEQAFFSSLARQHQSRGLKRMSPAFKVAGMEMPSRELSAELFQAIGDWFHYAILLLTEVETFKPDPRWIARQLGITPLEAKLAMERLRSLELLQDVNGKLRFIDRNITTANKAITTPALKRRQRQILEKAIDSLENDPIELRSMTGMTMAIDPSKLGEAKKLISEFNKKMSGFLENGKRTKVYELQIALFPLQKNQK